ncbi:zinc ABC transporter substrate-binding protein [Aceticella autotrophica]|uniref:Zinc ABC transporter substrate-binding protein n=1 Tax=Aceticella autotrophica TaxID=2755338 RepID=A0A975GB66_9THEO|nr:metal ABC transporter substrate-binding protein [Aceticella autotrophica]QSZ28118.1 zinc ABC transporter substrate-binding protein [Aceticella autotrophica]
MFKKSILTGLAVLLMFIMVFAAAGCGGSKTSDQAKKLKVVTTSTDIEDIVKGVGGDKVEVANIVPPGMCPGHFDVKPQSIQVLSDASLFILHSWDGDKFSDKLIESVGNKNLVKVVTTSDDGKYTFMVPQARIKGIDDVTAALVKVDSKNADTYKANAEKLKNDTNKIAQEQKKRLEDAGASKIKAIVFAYQVGFAKWAGLDIVGTYTPDISPNKTKELVDLGRQKGVTLIIDNLQTENKAIASTLAKEIGAKEIVPSNFPGGLPGTKGWSDSFIKNVDLIIQNK